MSALGLQRALGLRSYKTAWSWLHKLRRAMVRPGRDRLTGQVEVDETYVGGVHPGRRGRQRETKALVAVAVQLEGKRLGRIRLRRLPDASGPSLLAFVQDAVESKSLVHTDGWVGYDPLPASRLQAPNHVPGGPGQVAVATHASRPPGRVAPQALVVGHAPWGGHPRASRLLPRRVHVSVQPTPLAQPRQTVFPSCSAGGRRRPGTVRIARQVRPVRLVAQPQDIGAT